MAYPIVEIGDGWQCGKCGTIGETIDDAEECCESCQKCGLRHHQKWVEAEECCPCTCGGDYAPCSQDPFEDGDQELIDDYLARRQMISMFGTPPDDDEDIFTRAWDTITKNDLRTIPQLSNEQQAALESYQQNVDAAVGEPDVEDVRDESSDDACCRSLKEAIGKIPIDTWGMELLHIELTNQHYDMPSDYEDDNCFDFAATIQTQLEIWDYDWPSREYYDQTASKWKHTEDQPYPRGVDVADFKYDSDREQLRKDQVRQAFLEYQACRQQAEFDFGEEEEAHPLFTASADPFEAGWDSIAKIEIEVDSYDDLIMKSGIPPFPMGGVGEGITPEQMAWMARYGKRIDPAMPQRAMQHLGGPFVAPRSKAVFVNPANPNKVFKVNAGATLPIAFSHALAAMGYPVAPMNPMASFKDEEGNRTSVVGQDRLDVVPSISSGRRKSWPESGEAYFDDYTWLDMMRDTHMGRSGQEIPEGYENDWIDRESDAIRGMEFLRRRGIDPKEWAREFMRADRQDPDKFKPRYGDNTPQTRLANALNQELGRYKELEIQPGFERYPEEDGTLNRVSNLQGNEWEDPLLSWLGLTTWDDHGPNVGLDEEGRPMLSSFSIDGSPTMRVGNYGVAETSSDYQPMLKPRKEKGVEDGWDRAARRMFGQPIKARTVKFEKDPVYGLLRPVFGSSMRSQTKGGYLGALDAETGEPIDYPRKLPYSYGRTLEEILEENPKLAPLFGTSEDGVDINRAYKFAEMLQGFPAYEDDKGEKWFDSYGSEKRGDEEARRIYQMTRRPDDDHDLIWGRPQPENFKHQTEAEAEADENAWPGDSYEGQMKSWLRRHGGEPTPEMIEAARERYASLDPDWDPSNFPQKRYPHWRFHLKDHVREDPLLRYLAMNPGKEAILPIDRVRGFNKPGNDDEASGLFPFPMPQFFDANRDVFGLGREYDRQAYGGLKVPFNDGSGRELPTNFRLVQEANRRYRDFQPKGKRTEDGDRESPFADGWERMFDEAPKKLQGAGPQWIDPSQQDNNEYIRTIGALHDYYPLPESNRLAELLENMPDRSLFDANPKQQRIYDKFMKVFPKDVEFWRGMSDNPLMSNDEAFELYNRLRDSYDD